MIVKLGYIGRMNVHQLELLRELGALGSVQAVADALRLSPSAVSQQLKLLQRSTPVPLTERRGRQLRLTPAGEELADAAAAVATALAHARETARSLGRSSVDEVSVAAFNSAALAFFPALLAAVASEPLVRVRLRDEDVAQDAFDKLTRTQDIVIAHRLDHTPPWPPGVSATPLLHEPLDVALPVGHALAGDAKLSPQDLARQPWITTHDGYPLVATLDAIAAVAGHPIDIAHRVNEFSVAIELVRAGAGVAFVPRWTVPTPAGVVLRPVAGPSPRRHIDALHRPEKAVRSAVTVVLGHLQHIAGGLAG